MSFTTGAETASRLRLRAKQDKSVLSVQSLLNSHPGDEATFGDMSREPYTIAPRNFREWSPKIVPQGGHSKCTTRSKSPPTSVTFNTDRVREGNETSSYLINLPSLSNRQYRTWLLHFCCCYCIFCCCISVTVPSCCCCISVLLLPCSGQPSYKRNSAHFSLKFKWFCLVPVVLVKFPY